MSLLNDVLRDLAARNVPETVPAVRPVGRLTASRRPRWLLPAGLGIILALAGGWLVQRFVLRHAPHHPRIVITPAVRPEAPPRPVIDSRHPALTASEPSRPRDTRLTSARTVAHVSTRTLTARPKAMPRLEDAEKHGATTPAPAAVRPAKTEGSIQPSVSSDLRVEQRILQWIHAGEPAQAWSLAQSAAPAHPARHLRYLRLYAAVAAATAHWHSAVRLYRRLCRLTPSSANAWSGWSVSLLAAGHRRQARVAIRHALALGVSNPTLRRYLRREQRRLRTLSPSR